MATTQTEKRSIMTIDPSTGPIPRAKFYQLVNAPFGEATKIIRNYDPLFGYPDGHKIEWTAIFTKEIEGCAIVKAANADEAKRLAESICDSEIEWGDDLGTPDLQSVEIARQPHKWQPPG